MKTLNDILKEINYNDEAYTYLWYGISEREEISADLRSRFNEYGITDKQIRTMTNNIIKSIDKVVRGEI